MRNSFPIYSHKVYFKAERLEVAGRFSCIHRKVNDIGYKWRSGRGYSPGMLGVKESWHQMICRSCKALPL